MADTEKTGRTMKEVSQEIQYKHEDDLAPTTNHHPGPKTPEELNQSPAELLNEEVIKDMGVAG